ncbi:MAG: dTDP-4-dehydrorhamnose 3,5-epimerase family protein [bacterium]
MELKKEGNWLEGIYFAILSKHTDDRGWLCELLRHDEIKRCAKWANLKFASDNIPVPAMCYLSMTGPGVDRGPHEHKEQTDMFCFTGPSDFLIMLWDNRKGSPTYGKSMKLWMGDSNPCMLIVPPGVVHGYRNVGAVPGLVVNFPDRLYKGMNRDGDVDEIRHESDPNSPFRMGF